MSIKRIKISYYKRINESEEASLDKEFQEHLDDAMNRINNEGELPEDVFDVDGDWGSGCLRIKLDDKYNMLTWDRASRKYNLLFDEWYDSMGKSFVWGWIGISKYDDDENKVYNFINKQEDIFWDRWFSDVICGFNKDGNIFVEFDGCDVDVLTYDQGNLLSSSYNDYWHISDSYEISTYTKDKSEPWKTNTKEEWMYIVSNDKTNMLLVDCAPLELPFDSYNPYVRFEDYTQNRAYSGCEYFLLKNNTDMIYDATHKKIVDVGDAFWNTEDFNGIFIGDTHDGKIIINICYYEKYDYPRVAKGYKNIEIHDNDNKIVCITKNNKTVYLNIDTLEQMCPIEFDEVYKDDWDVIIGKVNNKYHICIDGKPVNNTGFDFAEEDSDREDIHVRNNNLWNIVDDKGRLLSPTWSTTEPYWSDYNDAYILTIDGKRAMLKLQPGDTYKLITEKLNENIIDEEISPEDVDLSSFAIKDELCPDFWEDGRFDQSARRTLLAIAKSFIEHLEIEDEVEDITVTGSIANYNWDENSSDIDLHILMDFSKLSDDPEILKKFFDAERKIWNKDHYEISIYGYPVEVYVQDINEEHHSSGIYSLLKDEWIKEPSKDNLSDENTDYDHVQEITSSIMTVIDELELDLDKDDPQTIYNDADTLFNNIKDIRKSGMGSDSPEMSDGNIIFKSLRRSGYMEKLIDIRTKAFDMIHSI